MAHSFLRDDATFAPVGFGDIYGSGALTNLTASLSGNVAMNNIANYFDGPSVAQGTSGTWFVSGKVTVNDTGSAANFNAKLWDGTTVIDSCRLTIVTVGAFGIISMSGIMTTPAGNLKISVQDASATTGLIQFNASGNSKDSTITAIRIG
jgi:hypothetical protein